jgi:hypothetical protein
MLLEEYWQAIKQAAPTYWKGAEELAEDQEPQSLFGLGVAEVPPLPDPRAYLPKEWSEGLPSSPDLRLLASADGLANLEALELGRPEVEGLVLSGPMVSGPKGLGSGPGLERGPALPYGVGGIQCVIFGLRTFE